MKRNKLSRRVIRFGVFQPIARAVMVVSAVAVLATGVTYAALQSPGATLTGNTISTATADLRIGTATTFGATKAGFSFNNVVPGGSPAPIDGNIFYMKNYGSAPLALKASIGSTPINSSNVDLSKVHIVLSRVDGSPSQKFSVSALVAAHATGGLAVTDNLVGTTPGQYKIQVAMDDDAFAGTTASISGVDIVFTGTIVSQ